MPNHLQGETSPYLLQHADNPVDWYPWNDEALALARQLDRPILLSIGYSACHWCHVMAHESFEDPATAEVMNRLFVNIKVDREERPDLDRIYQSAHQLLNQRGGGWPLNVFLSAEDLSPFFAATYFPPVERHGMPAFVDVLQRIADFYRDNRQTIREQNDRLLEALQSFNPKGGQDAVIDAGPLDQARQQLASHYDAKWGGFGQAPKFPHPTNLERLLRHHAATASGGEADEQALDMALTTLRAMARGGLFDQLCGGFYRYAVDDQWHIPHFEKMLYDNGPLLGLYSQAWQITGEALFRDVAEQTAGWVMDEMQSTEGGYYSALDADSDGEEGLYYLWTPGQIDTLLSPEEAGLFSNVYGLDKPANFEGRWHLHVATDIHEAARTSGHTEEQARRLIESAKAKLRQAQATRHRPGRDDKILTAWNGLMIKGMACAGRLLERPDLVASARQAVDFIRQNMFENNRLYATCKDGQARLMAYLDDHVFLLDGLLELLQIHWRSEDLCFARQLADILLAHFEDREEGGFFFTADDHESLIHRPKPVMDEAIPAGNGVAAQVLQRLALLVGDMRYQRAAERTLQCSWSSLHQHPWLHGALLGALEEHLYPPELIILRGEPGAMAPWQRLARQQYAPRRLLFAIPADARELPESLQGKATVGEVVAYPCRGLQCQPPVTSRADFARQLGLKVTNDE